MVERGIVALHVGVEDEGEIGQRLVHGSHDRLDPAMPDDMMAARRERTVLGQHDSHHFQNARNERGLDLTLTFAEALHGMDGRPGAVVAERGNAI